MVIAVPCIIARKWDQPRCPSKDKWLYTYTQWNIMQLLKTRTGNVYWVGKSGPRGQSLDVFSLKWILAENCVCVCNLEHKWKQETRKRFLGKGHIKGRWRIHYGKTKSKVKYWGQRGFSHRGLGKTIGWKKELTQGKQYEKPWGSLVSHNPTFFVAVL